ncbi:hypothetical protein [Butyrivibrio sp. MC2021]|uniref:hypothetical protein n=1 Tax=Butyrivibrio sp. MC2021 TaxID=1408306 RepID=UPI00047C6696|nr:hypothetical protein [Butyrivibrio sp. MC2021]
MDSKVFRMALLVIISVFALIAVIVYATNADRINGLLGKKSESAAVAVSAEETSLSLPEEAYGEQIGENLNGFLYDEDFFDETEKIPSVVVIKKSAASASISDEDEAAYVISEDDIQGTGMAVVGQLENPGDEASFDISGAMSSLPAVVPIEGASAAGAGN